MSGRERSRRAKSTELTVSTSDAARARFAHCVDRAHLAAGWPPPPVSMATMPRGRSHADRAWMRHGRGLPSAEALAGRGARSPGRDRVRY